MQAIPSDVRSDWTREEVEAVYRTPLLELVFRAATLHRRYHPAHEVQLSTLLSIKTGGCPEDCAYCPQSAHYETNLETEALLETERVVDAAQRAQAQGATRFCMGAAWRTPPSERRFTEVLDMIKEVRALGMETCATLGMLKPGQAERLKDAGLDYYNHNLDTSPEFYGEIISTRTYQDRLDTLARVREAGLNVCCGGIIGMGESPEDVCGLLHQLASMAPHPESVPINSLVAVEGTPLGHQTPVDPLDFIRTVATARVLMPKSFVRLSAGRTRLTPEAHALAFLAGANSIFTGDKLLTTPNPGEDFDTMLLHRLGLRPLQIEA